MGPDQVADVIVVGAGNAALVAALSAHEQGARVLVLEAAPRDQRGGNSRFSGGIFRFAHGGLDHLRPLLTEEGAKWADRVTVASMKFLITTHTSSATTAIATIITITQFISY